MISNCFIRFIIYSRSTLQHPVLFNQWRASSENQSRRVGDDPTILRMVSVRKSHRPIVLQRCSSASRRYIPPRAARHRRKHGSTFDCDLIHLFPTAHGNIIPTSQMRICCRRRLPACPASCWHSMPVGVDKNWRASVRGGKPCSLHTHHLSKTTRKTIDEPSVPAP